MMGVTGKHAIISYTDLAAAGSRTCFGIDGEVDVQALDLTELLGDQPLAVLEGENAQAAPVQVRKHGEVACYLVNCHIPSRVSHQVANRLLDRVVGSGAQQLTVLTALRPDPKHAGAASTVMESCLNCKSGSDFPAVPADFQVEDAFLNALLSLLKVEDIPTRILVARGYRASKGCPSDNDGSLQTIENLQSAVSKLTGLQFSKERTSKLNYVAPEDGDRGRRSMLYM